MGKVVLVTGVAGDIGRHFALRLAESSEVDRVIGVDLTPPPGDHTAIAFVRLDIRNPVIAKIIARERVDTVVHTTVVASDAKRVGRLTVKENNIIGSMQLLAACQDSPHLQRLVMKSSTSFYGSSPRDPAMFTEEMTPKNRPQGFTKDLNEVESYVRGFARRRPDVEVATLRFANAVGERTYSALTNYLKLPVIPTVMGFNPRLQLVHEDDVIAGLEKATLSDAVGTFNIAGAEVMRLHQMIRRLGRASIALPRPAISSLVTPVKQLRLADLSSEMLDYLSYGRALDTTRMVEELGFVPQYTTPEALADFAAAMPPGPLEADRVERVERQLAKTFKVSHAHAGFSPGSGPGLAEDSATEGGHLNG